MRFFYSLMLLTLSLTAFAETAELSLMPYPAEVQLQQGQLALTEDFSIAVPADMPQLKAAADHFMQRLSRQTGLRFNAAATPVLTLLPDNTTSAVLIPQADMAEQYQLLVNEQQIILSAPDSTGIVRGLETLLQLVQTDASGSSIAALSITDKPRFAWRGVLLDPARRFLPISTLKRQLDIMAAVKLNVLHLHLTDDQGWRFESLRYPKLQQVAGKDGYYSQQQLRDLVQYAAQRGIRIVPEIDLPGHTTALGAAYPELMAMPGPTQPETHWGVHPAALDPTNEQVYTFLANLLAEVAAVFPDHYLHIGGDEVLPDHWLGSAHIADFMRQQQLADAPALQAYFNQRLQRIVQQLGRKMIGWDEVLDGKLPDSVLVQSWRGTESLAAAAKAGHQAILSTGYYLDQPQFAGYHYRNDPLPQAATMPELSTLQHWSAWQFQFERKRGSAISGKLLLLYQTDASIDGVVQFAGRQPQRVAQLTLNANQLSFSLDSWMGPLRANFTLNDSPHGKQLLSGSLTVGNAAYPVAGQPEALLQDADTTAAIPIRWQAQPLDNASKARVLGGEIALWGELVTPDNIDIRLWPNGFAVAERLWSDATVRDEHSMYRRLQQVFKQATALQQLHTVRHQQQGFSTLVGPDKLAALNVLSQTLEPAHYYHRLHEKSVAGLYHVNAPLNQLVDFLSAEHPVMRRFEQEVTKWLTTRDQESYQQLITQLQQWQQAAAAFSASSSVPFSELASQVEQLSAAGITLLNSIEKQQPLNIATRTALSQQLTQAAAIQQEMIIALNRPLQHLLKMAPDSNIWLAAGSFTAAAEGPAVDSNGNLYAVNFGRAGTIGRVSPAGEAALFIDLPAGSTGNGIVFDRRGSMFIADYTGHNILKYADNKLSVHAHNSNMNQPNDLAIMDNGTVFASDPNWADNTGQLWRITPDGATTLLAAMGTTNGIAVSPDQQFLYVNESVQRAIWRFNINADRSLSNKQLVARFSDFGLDGMRVDQAGNLYVARYGKGTVLKLSGSGELLAEYRLNHPLPTNVALNQEQSLLYITIQQCGCIEQIALTP